MAPHVALPVQRLRLREHGSRTFLRLWLCTAIPPQVPHPRKSRCSAPTNLKIFRDLARAMVFRESESEEKACDNIDQYPPRVTRSVRFPSFPAEVFLSLPFFFPSSRRANGNVRPATPRLRAGPPVGSPPAPTCGMTRTLGMKPKLASPRGSGSGPHNGVQRRRNDNCPESSRGASGPFVHHTMALPRPRVHYTTMAPLASWQMCAPQKMRLCFRPSRNRQTADVSLTEEPDASPIRGREEVDLLPPFAARADPCRIP